MSIAIRRINDAKARAVRILKIDRFLADSHWEVVEEKTVIENPFDSDDEELEVWFISISKLMLHLQAHVE